MSASLVGSEMCIRDRLKAAHSRSSLLKAAQNCSKLLNAAQSCSKRLNAAHSCSMLLKAAQMPTRAAVPLLRPLRGRLKPEPKSAP
eukprot:6830803-Alexandrium_andersonii.AAC.1